MAGTPTSNGERALHRSPEHPPRSHQPRLWQAQRLRHDHDRSCSVFSRLRRDLLLVHRWRVHRQGRHRRLLGLS
ncbi:unnamed protein product [Oikopleura dioica]|uniref:Uncharacterized protein n=1 Tax=Oikopleura dioica TaxID=34765 RepID=E4YJR8_OIKDI|nr:unnamed protein product [Oikopleura dioica]